jgi:hypothetical protein
VELLYTLDNSKNAEEKKTKLLNDIYAELVESTLFLGLLVITTSEAIFNFNSF